MSLKELMQLQKSGDNRMKKKTINIIEFRDENGDEVLNV